MLLRVCKKLFDLWKYWFHLSLYSLSHWSLEKHGREELPLSQAQEVEVRNRFKGLDLIDRVPDELWMAVSDIVQETGTRPSPWKRNSKKQNGCLRRPYIQLWKEEKWKAKEKRKIYPFESILWVPKNSKER